MTTIEIQNMRLVRTANGGVDITMLERIVDTRPGRSVDYRREDRSRYWPPEDVERLRRFLVEVKCSTENAGKWWVFQRWLAVDRGWRFCPICGAPRPLNSVNPVNSVKTEG